MRTRLPFSVSVLLCCLTSLSPSQTPLISAQPRARILQRVDDNRTVRLRGNVHPLAARATSQVASEQTPMEHMILFLKMDSAQQTELQRLIVAQNDPKSPNYHKFLTPAEYGARFGVAQADIEKVTSWLRSHGFIIEELPPSRHAVVFSGNSGQVTEAFKTEIRSFSVAGAAHVANASDPQIPAALSEVVGGVVKLHNFRHSSQITSQRSLHEANLASPQFTYGSNHYLSPADYATIYDINPLYAAGIDGSGQSIAIIARSNISLADVEAFRGGFGLPANDPNIVLVNSDPGIVPGDSTETILDTEWSGAVAPKANVKVIVAGSTNSADGIDLSALYAVNNNVAPVVSVSYGSCEAYMGSAELSFYNSLWQQAASQGMSVMVSSGDSGAAGCNAGSSSSGSGPAINGLCSSPYSTCVGGTEFVEGNNPGQYWLAGNSNFYGSATGYIPETVWNESASNGGSGLWSGGGGASIYFGKPAWQSGSGVPADGHRDVPDVSLTAAGHDGYVIVQSGYMQSVGGTSASAPSFAGLMALVNQKTGARAGLANATFYPLATLQQNSGAAIFHDTITGNNTVPGTTGFNASTGYDLASGLGSVDAALLVNHWTDASQSTPALTLSATPASLSILRGQSATTVLTANASGLQSAVTLSVSGAPAGVTASLAASSIASPGSGSVVLTVAVAGTVAPGNYSLIITAQGGSQTTNLTVSLVVPNPTFTLSSANSYTLVTGSTGQVVVSTTPQNGFAGTLSLSVSGLPAGVTAVLSPTSLNGATAASSSLNLAAAKTATPGSYALKVTASGGGIMQTASITLQVVAPASCTLAASPTTLSLNAGNSATLQVTCNAIKGTFASPLSLSFTGLPDALTATGAPLTPGSATTVTIASSSSAAAGSYTLSLTATGSGFSKTVTVPVSVKAPASFTLSASTGAISITAGGSGQMNLTTTRSGSFSAGITLSASGLPAGVTAAFSKTTLPAPGNGTSAVTFAASAGVQAGSYAVTLTAIGGGVTRTAPVNLTVVVPPSCTLSANPSSVTLLAGQSAGVQLACSSVQGAFTGPLALSFTGLPAAVTASGASLTAGSSTTASFASTAKAAAGSYSVGIMVTGSGFSKKLTLPLTIKSVPATFSLSSSQTAVTVGSGSSTKLTLTTVHSGSFNSAVTLKLSGLPSGATSAFSLGTLAAPGDGTSALTITVPSSAQAGTYPLVITATGGGVTQTVTVNLTVGTGPNFTFTVSTNALTIQKGKSGTVVISTGQFTGGFNSTITLILTGLPPGMNYGSTGATTGNNMVNISMGITVAPSTTLGTYPIAVQASGAGIKHTAVVQVTVVN